MTTASLSNLTLATIENYRHAANEAARAYRVGSHRLIGALNHSLAQNVDVRTSKVAPQLTSQMLQVRARVTDVVGKGIDQLTIRTEKAVEVGSDGAAEQVRKVAAFAAGIDNPAVANGLQAVARLSLPGAKVALAVSSKVAAGAKVLSSKAQGKSVQTTVKSVTGTAKRTVAKAKRTTAKTVRAVAAAPKKAAVRAKRKLAA